MSSWRVLLSAHWLLANSSKRFLSELLHDLWNKRSLCMNLVLTLLQKCKNAKTRLPLLFSSFLLGFPPLTIYNFIIRFHRNGNGISKLNQIFSKVSYATCSKILLASTFLVIALKSNKYSWLVRELFYINLNKKLHSRDNLRLTQVGKYTLTIPLLRNSSISLSLNVEAKVTAPLFVLYGSLKINDHECMQKICNCNIAANRTLTFCRFS